MDNKEGQPPRSPPLLTPFWSPKTNCSSTTPHASNWRTPDIP